jgi:hypothetical protein
VTKSRSVFEAALALRCFVDHPPKGLIRRLNFAVLAVASHIGRNSLGIEVEDIRREVENFGKLLDHSILRWGQFMFVAPKANVVIVRTGSDFGIDIVQWSQVFQYIADAVSRGEASPSVP